MDAAPGAAEGEIRRMKTNPRKRPVTVADLERVKKKAFKEAADYATAIFLTVLLDKENADKEAIIRVWKEINELCDSVIEGYVSVADLRQVLRDEYGVC